MPSGEETFISNLEVNENVINGGASIVTFTSSEALSEFFVGVKGIDGYFACPVVATYMASSEQEEGSGSYEYEAMILLNQNLSEEKFAVTLSATTKSGKTNKVLNSDEIDVIIVGTGKLQVSLSWDQLDDVDLYLFEPDRDYPIYYGNRFSSDNADEMFDFYCYLADEYTDHSTADLKADNEADWELLFDYLNDLPNSVNLNEEIKKYSEGKDKITGFLDLDSNASCNIDGVNNENITYGSKVKDGEYIVAVDLYEKCNASKPGAKYMVTVNYDGKPVTFASVQNGQFADSNAGNYSDIDGLVVLGKFKISGGKFEVVTGTRSMSLTPAASTKSLNKKFLEKLKQFK